jgi:hypothetical protein
MPLSYAAVKCDCTSKLGVADDLFVVEPYTPQPVTRAMACTLTLR